MADSHFFFLLSLVGFVLFFSLPLFFIGIFRTVVPGSMPFTCDSSFRPSLSLDLDLFTVFSGLIDLVVLTEQARKLLRPEQLSDNDLLIILNLLS